MAIYNIVYRANKNLKFFTTDEDYFIFWENLLYCLDKYKGKVLAVGLMTHHVHLFLNLKAATLSNFLRSFMSRQKHYYSKLGRVGEGERATLKNGMFIQEYAEDNEKGIRSNIIYVNCNYYKENPDVDICNHLSSAIPFTIAQFKEQDSYSENIFIKYWEFKKYFHVLDLTMLKRIFGKANDIFIENFVQEHWESKGQEEKLFDKSMNIEEVIGGFLESTISVRFYKNKSEKLIHLSAKDRIKLMQLLISKGVYDRKLIANYMMVSIATVYRYLKIIRGGEPY